MRSAKHSKIFKTIFSVLVSMFISLVLSIAANYWTELIPGPLVLKAYLATVICLVLLVETEIFRKLPENRARLISVIVTVILIMLAVILFRAYTPKTDPSGTIAFPNNGDKIERNFAEITGTIEYLPDGQLPWIYIKSDSRYYFRRVTTFPDESWAVRNVTVGAIAQVGTRFEIGLIFANAEASEVIVASSSSTIGLPNGVNVLDRITVIRR